jgi:hypothetical protein
MVMNVQRLLVALLFVALAGCSDSPTGPDQVSINGTWSGSTSGLSVTVTINESAGQLSGSGNLSGPNGSVATQVSGTRAGTDLSMTLTAQGYEPTNFTGQIQNNSTITGSLSGSGFSDVSVTLSK